MQGAEQGNRMIRSRKFMQNDRGKEFVVKSAAETFGFHAEFDSGERFI